MALQPEQDVLIFSFLGASLAAVAVAAAGGSGSALAGGFGLGWGWGTGWAVFDIEMGALHLGQVTLLPINLSGTLKPALQLAQDTLIV